MIKDFALFALKVIIVISAIAAMISPIFFREGGLIWGTITRKTVIVISICFGIFLLAIWVALSIDDPSKSIGALICLGGVSIIPGIYFVSLYLRLPRLTQKYHQLQRDRQKILHKDEDSNDQ
jgi:hypothetical protein